jgi:hypothetical protein
MSNGTPDGNLPPPAGQPGPGQQSPPADQQVGIASKAQDVHAFSWWHIAPLVSGVAFFAIFFFCAKGLNLSGDTAFQWATMRTNLGQILPNHFDHSKSLDQSIARSYTNSVTFTNSLILTNTLIITNSGVVTNPTVVPNMFVPTNWLSTNIFVVTNTLLGTNTMVANAQVRSHRMMREHFLRLLWGVSCVAFGALCLALVVQSIRIVYQVSETAASATKGSAIWRAGIVIVVALLLFLIFGALNGGTVATPSGGQAVESLLDAAESPDGAVRDPGFPSLVPHIRPMVTWLSAGTAAALFAIACAACYLLYATRRAKEVGDANEFKRRTDSAHDLAGLTAFALVAGTIEIYLLFNLTAMHVYPILLDEARRFATGMAIIAGLIYSGLIAAIFLPVALWQREYGKEFKANMGVQFNAQAGVEPGLKAVQDTAEPGWRRLLKAILTVLAPLLGALLTKLVVYLAELADV